MGYALFAQRKIVLDGQLNSAQLQQTQRSNEQYKLATQTLSLQQQMTSMTSSQSYELSLQYEKLARVGQKQVFKIDGKEVTETEYNNSTSDKKTTEWVSDDSKDHDKLEDERATINAEIKSIEAKNQAELDEINRQIYLVGIKEAAVEMEVKRLDTMVSALQKQLEAVEEAEGKAIDRATPKFNGVG